jgi:transcriptional regulator with XRE-family HTH domain
MNYQNTIKLLRHQQGRTQAIAAEKLGISIPAYSKIEAGITDVNMSRLLQIAEIYNVTVTFLLSENVKIEPSEVENLKAKNAKLSEEVNVLQSKAIQLYEELRGLRKELAA